MDGLGSAGWRVRVVHGGGFGEYMVECYGSGG